MRCGRGRCSSSIRIWSEACSARRRWRRASPTPARCELAEALVARLSAELQAPTYARVDLLRSAEGDPLILELELIEPSLFLDHQPAAADRLIELLAASLADAG